MSLDAYLLRDRKSKTAHVWLGRDTACRMFSTGGLNPKKYSVRPTPEGRPICQMCQNVVARRARP